MWGPGGSGAPGRCRSAGGRSGGPGCGAPVAGGAVPCRDVPGPCPLPLPFPFPSGRGSGGASWCGGAARRGMALVTVRRAGGSAGGPAEEDAPRRGQLQRRQSFVMVKGAARLLPAEEPPPAEPPPAEPPCQAPGQQEQHLHLMMQLLRPQDAIRLAVRLESARPRRVRYLLLVRPEEAGAEAETALLGVDFAHEGATRCTLGMVLPLWSDTQVFLDGDGGFSVTSGGQTRIFKPISVQTMWAVLQELHRACEDAARGGHIPGGPALAWARGYAAALGSEQSCLNEWLAMADLESVRPASPTTPLRPAVPELSEQAVRALLREVMATADLENVTSKEVREELERRTGHSLAEHKDFIDNEMLLVLAQMDRPSRVFPHLFLGSEWNAANLEELQQNRVTHILNVAREIDNFFPALFTYMNVRVYDEEAAELLPHWNDTFLFLSRVRRHSSLWEPRAAEQAPQPEEDTARDTSGLSPLSSPLASPQPSEEEAAGAGLLGASRRPRISLCSVMRSISLLETPEPLEVLGEPLAGEVFEATEKAEGPSPRSRPSSRPRGVVRQASLDGGPAPFCDHAHSDCHTQGHTHAPGQGHTGEPTP
ncbi:protein phosphatase Slingshot homolog 3 isoform X3 [Onychostruthus taczanowskii]|uniref:protein phosphatase Slingshot homolog 3 isoform X3 n=1 Tax=Onychostruthus taczanowskii TaxID=356909 RepID=UPI001B802783|nr:protein phosphatase Slingshot homolog 3 isoform X3 [Onychostruthus taczanowskii]